MIALAKRLYNVRIINSKESLEYICGQTNHDADILKLHFRVIFGSSTVNKILAGLLYEYCKPNRQHTEYDCLIIKQAVELIRSCFSFNALRMWQINHIIRIIGSQYPNLLLLYDEGIKEIPISREDYFRSIHPFPDRKARSDLCMSIETDEHVRLFRCKIAADIL